MTTQPLLNTSLVSSICTFPAYSSEKSCTSKVTWPSAGFTHNKKVMNNKSLMLLFILNDMKLWSYYILADTQLSIDYGWKINTTIDSRLIKLNSLSTFLLEFQLKRYFVFGKLFAAIKNR